tara:strand:+ start:425 stop:571 length:147 start_codon:yes stop_codon:yes gene_type:complete
MKNYKRLRTFQISSNPFLHFDLLSGEEPSVVLENCHMQSLEFRRKVNG